MTTEIAPPTILPLDLLIAAGLDGSFEQLPEEMRGELLFRRINDRADRLAQLRAEVATERHAFDALVALAEFVEPAPVLEPLYPNPRKVETHD
jgi:hypothetical protein